MCSMQRALCTGITLFALMLAGARGGEAADAIRFQLDWLPGADKASIYVGVEAGFFADEDIEVSIASGRGSTDALTRLSAGAADIGFTDLTALMQARAQSGLEVKALMSVFSAAPHAFFVLDDSGIDEVSKLTEKRIATSPFSASNLFLNLLLASQGIEEEEVRVINANASALGPMLITGKADAVIGWITDTDKYAAQAAKVRRGIRVLPWYAVGMEVYATSVVANEGFLAANPELVRRFLRAFRRAVEFTWANPDAAAEMVHRAIPEINQQLAEDTIRNTEPLVLNEVSARDGLGSFTPERVRETWSWVARATGVAEDSYDPEDALERSIVTGLFAADHGAATP